MAGLLAMALACSIAAHADERTCEGLVSTSAYRTARASYGDVRLARPYWMKAFRLKQPSVVLGFALLSYLADRGGTADVATTLADVTRDLGRSEKTVYQGFLGLLHDDLVMTERGGGFYVVKLTATGLAKMTTFVNQF